MVRGARAYPIIGLGLEPVMPMSDARENARQYRIDDLILDQGQRRVFRNDDAIDLPKLSFDLLVALADSAPNVVTIDELAKAVWGEVVVSDETVTQRVKMLRDALDVDGDKQRYVETVRATGYRLRSAVQPVGAAQADRGISRTLVVFGVAVIAVLVAVYYFRSEVADVQTEPASPTVAVLPFVALSGGADDGYFADGLTEEIINALAQLPELLVTARTSAFYFKGEDIPVPEIAATLGVEHIVEGSIRREGDELRITAQLIRAEGGFHVWSNTYERTLESVFGVQIDIAEKVAASLDVVLDEDRRMRMRAAGVRDPEAFIAYQKGMEIFNTAHGSDRMLHLLRDANGWFETAIAHAPNFSDAYLRHSDYYSHILLYAATGETIDGIPEEDVSEAAAALVADFEAAARSAPDLRRRRGVELDKAIFLGEWQNLAARLDGVTADPGCTTPAWIDVVALPYGSAAASRELIGQVAECDPLDFGGRLRQVRMLIWLREFEAAIDVATAAGESIGHPLFRIFPVVSLIAMGRSVEAEALSDDRPVDEAVTLGGRFYLATARSDAVNGRVLMERYVEAFGPSARLAFLAVLGERDAANRLASQADARPFGHMVLAGAIEVCYCGAPFDLEVTPNFARKIEESGLTWPPTAPVEWPLKTW